MNNKASKTKHHSSSDDLEKEFYTPVRMKKSNYQENIENIDQNRLENRLVKVPLQESKKKGLLSDSKRSFQNQFKEEEVISPEHHKKIIIKKSKPDDFEKLSLADVLDCKFTPDDLQFRDKEVSEILGFIADCLNSKKHDSLFVTGNPGTGKSLTLNYVLHGLNESGVKFFENRIQGEKYKNIFEKKYSFKVHNFNAMSYKNPLEFYGDLYEAMANKKICEKSNQANFGIVFDELKTFICSSENIHLAFVDEIDNLFTSKQNSTEIFEIFKLPKYPGSKLFLFGASNTIDLIIKLNQQYKIAFEMKNIVFQPYNFEEILNIIKGRIQNEKFASNSTLFDEFGLKYCAKKISVLKGGDIRCALDIVKKVYVEKISENEKESSEKKILMEDMVKVFEQFYGKKLTDLISTIPHIQKSGLVGLYLLLTKKSAEKITKADFLSAYNKIADATCLNRLTINDIEDMLQAYTTYQFVNIKNIKKTLAPSKVNSSMKNKNEELVPLITAEQIKEALIEDEFFSKFFEQ